MKKTRIMYIVGTRGSTMRRPRGRSRTEFGGGQRTPRNNQAFTLVELASVIVIIALIIGMSVSTGVTIISSTKVSATQQKMAAIDQALMAYRLANDRLPCPSDLTLSQGNTSYGVAGTCATSNVYGVRVATTVNVAEGGVPVYDLGLPYDFMYDGWGNRIRYAVDTNMANTGLNGSGFPNNANTFKGTQIGAQCGQITIQGDPMPVSPAAYGGANNYKRSTSAIYALISEGPNGHGAISKTGAIVNAGSQNADELANCNCGSTGSQNANITGTYVQEQPYTYNSANPLYNFDDIVTYKERWQMQAPWDSAGVACPRMYIADSGNNRIEVFNLNGNYVSQFAGAGGVTFSNPNGIFVDNNSNAWVVDSNNNRILKFALSPSGTPTFIMGIGAGYNGVSGSIGSSGTGSGQFTCPYSVAIDGYGNIWVVDSGRTTSCTVLSTTTGNRIEKFDSNGNFLLGIGDGYNGVTGTIGTSSSNPGGFKTPFYLAIDASNNVWVSDYSNNRIQEFDNNGNWLQTIGSLPNNPNGIAIDQSGNVWVVESAGGTIVEYSNTGTQLNTINIGVRGIAFDPSGSLWADNNGGGTYRKCSQGSSGWTCTGTMGGAGSGNGQLTSPTGMFITQTR